MSRPKTPPEGFKYCSGCKEYLPLESFGLSKNGSQGRRNKCKSCRNKDEKAYSQQNVARVSEWRKNNPDKDKILRGAWNKSDGKKTADKRWVENHPEYVYAPTEQAKENKKAYTKKRKEQGLIEKIALKSRLKIQYGLTVEEYEKLLSSHQGVCAICGEQETAVYNGKIKRLAIDHNHETGEVRGILCDRCNRGLGFFRNSSQLLLNAARYIDEH